MKAAGCQRICIELNCVVPSLFILGWKWLPFFWKNRPMIDIKYFLQTTWCWAQAQWLNAMWIIFPIKCSRGEKSRGKVLDRRLLEVGCPQCRHVISPHSFLWRQSGRERGRQGGTVWGNASWLCSGDPGRLHKCEGLALLLEAFLCLVGVSAFSLRAA